MTWSTAHRPPGPSERVLVVDRGEDAAFTQMTLLQLQGFDARAASSGRSALAVAAEHRPDLVLIDLDLDDRNPYDVIRSLREVTAPPSVVVLTAHTTPACRQAASDVGASAFVLKPADPEGLARLLHQLGQDRVAAAYTAN